MAETKNTKAFYNTEIPSSWRVRKLGDFIERIVGGGTPSRDNPKYWNGKIKWATVKDFSNFNPYGTQETITEEGLKNSASNLIPKETLITATRMALGKVVKFNIDVAINQDLKAIFPKPELDSGYLFYWFDKNTTLIEGLGNGSTVKGITLDDLKGIPFYQIPLPEQRAIARVLSIWDEAIQKTEKLIAQKELRKKWLMQNLLTGKMRLKGFEGTKWKIQPLENFIKPIVREVPKPSTPYLGIGLRSHGKGTFLKHDEQPEKNSMDNFYVVRPNDLIVNITFAWEQAIAIVRPEDDGALASHRFPTYTFIEDKGHPDFFRFYILQPRMKFMLQMISPGGAGRNRVMSKSDFIKLEFLLPEYKEQTAIAQVLQAADKEISLLKAKAGKFREQKKGLMQVLLTEKKRLKID